MEYKKIGSEFAPSWQPENTGDKTEGTITEFDSRETEHGTYTIITIEKTDGTTIAVHAAHKVLADQVNELVNKHGMKVGDTFGVVYNGKLKSKTGRSYNDYSVAWEAAPTGTMTATATPAATPATADNGPDF